MPDFSFTLPEDEYGRPAETLVVRPTRLIVNLLNGTVEASVQWFTSQAAADQGKTPVRTPGAYTEDGTGTPLHLTGQTQAILTEAVSELVSQLPFYREHGAHVLNAVADPEPEPEPTPAPEPAPVVEVPETPSEPEPTETSFVSASADEAANAAPGAETVPASDSPESDVAPPSEAVALPEEG